MGEGHLGSPCRTLDWSKGRSRETLTETFQMSKPMAAQGKLGRDLQEKPEPAKGSLGLEKEGVGVLLGDEGKTAEVAKEP